MVEKIRQKSCSSKKLKSEKVSLVLGKKIIYRMKENDVRGKSNKTLQILIFRHFREASLDKTVA